MEPLSKRPRENIYQSNTSNLHFFTYWCQQAKFDHPTNPAFQCPSENPRLLRVFHKENLRFEPNKEDPFQQLMLNLLSSVAQFERQCILQRQREGIAIAKSAGKYKGKQSRFTEAQIEQIQREFDEAKSKSALAKRWGISRGYLYKIAAKV